MTALDTYLPVRMGPPERRAERQGALFENLAFGVATIFTAMFAVVVARKAVDSIRNHGFGWDTVAVLIYVLLLWGVLAYLALPRIHRILTALYVPDYFIGRSRTSDGLLGDPINLALLGSADQIHYAMQAAGWARADPINLGSSLRIISASLTRRSYRRAPVSTLLVFAQPQAFAYQHEVQGSPARRHHVRFWQCPEGWLLPGGRRVDWLAAGTYDRAVGLSLFTLQVTHKIDADIDAERDHILASIQQAVPDASVEQMRDFTSSYHARNGGGDAIRTDGMLPIVDLRPAQLPARTGATRVERRLPTSAAAVATEIGRRPVSVVLASVLILLQVVSSLAVGLQDGLFVLPDDVEGEERQVVMIALIAAQVFATVLSAWLAWLVYRGRNWARLLVLVLISMTLVSEFTQFLVADVPGRLTLVDMTVQLLIIYALTSASARAWTHRRSSLTKRAGTSLRPGERKSLARATVGP